MFAHEHSGRPLPLTCGSKGNTTDLFSTCFREYAVVKYGQYLNSDLTMLTRAQQ